MPPLCAHHQAVYATRTARLRKAIHHPHRGHKALIREARTIAGQCAACIATNA